MIHTFQLIFDLDKEDIVTLEENMGANYKQLNDQFQLLYGEHFNDALTTQVSYSYGKWHLSLFVDAVRLLGRADIQEVDYLNVKSRVLEFLMLLFGHTTHFDEHVLKRIDYRYDVTVPDEHLRKLYFHLISKHVEQFRFQRKYKGKKNSLGQYEEYGTTLYHSSGSVITTAYDKEAERKAKGCIVEKYEKNVIRFEVRLLYDHLYYKASDKCMNHTPMRLKSYLNEALYYDYLQKYLLSIYPSGDYYKYEKAEQIIRHSALKSTDKQLLKKFLLKTSSFSMSTPQKHVSKYKYKKAIQLLKNLHINPVPIPKNYPKAPKYFQNPLKELYAKFS